MYKHMNKRGESGRKVVGASSPRKPCLCSKLRRAARLVAQLYDEEVRSSGLAMSQLGLLGTLASSGELTQGQLAERLNLDSTTLTRTLAPLTAKGWIEKGRFGEDLRERQLRVTPLGLEQLRGSAPLWERAQRRMRQSLGEADWEQIQRLLSRVIEVAQQG